MENASMVLPARLPKKDPGSPRHLFSGSFAFPLRIRAFAVQGLDV
jgi:hypothetical protein